jgi:hypothetical protein
MNCFCRIFYSRVAGLKLEDFFFSMGRGCAEGDLKKAEMRWITCMLEYRTI